MIFSKYLIAGMLGWIIAQGAKYILVTIKNKNLNSVNKLYLSGGMPSAHSATTVAIVTVIAIIDGLDSSIFALAAIVTAIVVYDAIMVRRSSGEQGIAILNLLKEQNSNVKPPFVALGHNWIEASVGSLLGLIIGVIVAGY